jgi:hypothetical protein
MLVFGLLRLGAALIWKAGERTRIIRGVWKSIHRLEEIDPQLYDYTIRMMARISGVAPYNYLLCCSDEYDSKKGD